MEIDITGPPKAPLSNFQAKPRHHLKQNMENANCPALLSNDQQTINTFGVSLIHGTPIQHQPFSNG